MKRFSDLPSLDSCLNLDILLASTVLGHAWYLRIGQCDLLTREEVHEFDYADPGEQELRSALMQRSMPYINSLLAFLDPLSGAKWLQTLTTERIDEAVKCLIVIALLHTSVYFPETKLEPLRDILEHYWILITKRLHMFASDGSIGNAVVKRLLIAFRVRLLDCRARLVPSKGNKHLAGRSEQELRDRLYMIAERPSREGIDGQTALLWDFFAVSLPPEDEEEEFSLSDEHSESEASNEVDDEGRWICPNCGRENKTSK